LLVPDFLLRSVENIFDSNVVTMWFSGDWFPSASQYATSNCMKWMKLAAVPVSL